MFRRFVSMGMIILLSCFFSVDLLAQESQEKAGKSQISSYGEKKSSKKITFNPEQGFVSSVDAPNEKEVVTEENARVQKAQSDNEKSSSRGGSSGGGGSRSKIHQ